MTARDTHPLAGQTVILNTKGESDPDHLDGSEFRIEDWWVNVSENNTSWMWCDGNPACMKYGIRSGIDALPTDDEVVYGKVGSFGHLIHVSELGEVVAPVTV